MPPLLRCYKALVCSAKGSFAQPQMTLKGHASPIVSVHCELIHLAFSQLTAFYMLQTSNMHLYMTPGCATTLGSFRAVMASLMRLLFVFHATPHADCRTLRS